MNENKLPCFQSNATVGDLDEDKQWSIEASLGDTGEDWMLEPVEQSDLINVEVETPDDSPYTHQMYIEALMPPLYALVSLGPEGLINNDIAISGTVTVGEKDQSIKNKKFNTDFGVCNNRLKMFVQSSKFEGQPIKLILKYNKEKPNE